MLKFNVQLALEAVAEARAEWAKQQTEFTRQIDYVMTRLINEAAVNLMSAEEISRYSGLTIKRVRTLMRINGMNPRDSRRLLSAHAAKTLADNAEIMGVEPHEIDLMSPLAYLPAGKDLRKFLETGPVTEIDPVYEVAYLLWQFNQGYILAEDRAVCENWMTDPVESMHVDDAAELPGWLDAARTILSLVGTR